MRDGYHVGALDIDEEGLDSLVVEAGSELSSKLLVTSCDVSSEKDVERAVGAIVRRFGRLDCCFNNAGIEGPRAKMIDLSADEFDRVLAVNLRSVFLCMKHEIRQMLKLQRSDSSSASLRGVAPVDKYRYAIVNTSSTAGLFAMPEFSSYCASKHGIVALTKCAAREYASDGIRVNAICPSTVSTPMVERFEKQWPEWQRKQNNSFPVGRVGNVEEIANAVAWLCSSSCPFMTGTTLTIDGAASS